MLSRLVWILVLLLAAVAIFKPLRERALSHFEPALNPVYEWKAKNDVNDLQRAVMRELATGGPLPKAREFTDFLEQRAGPGSSIDPWGEPFYLSLTRRNYKVASSGPDRVRHTPDDIFATPAPRPQN